MFAFMLLLLCVYYICQFMLLLFCNFWISGTTGGGRPIHGKGWYSNTVCLCALRFIFSLCSSLFLVHIDVFEKRGMPRMVLPKHCFGHCFYGCVSASTGPTSLPWNPPIGPAIGAGFAFVDTYVLLMSDFRILFSQISALSIRELVKTIFLQFKFIFVVSDMLYVQAYLGYPQYTPSKQ